MKAAQKLKATIESISFIVTRSNLPREFDFLVTKLEMCPEHEASCTHTNTANLTMYLALDYVGPRPKSKIKLFGQDEEVFMARQYK